MNSVKRTDPIANCIFCHTYYFPMLIMLDNVICHECWKDVIELVKSELAQYND